MVHTGASKLPLRWSPPGNVTSKLPATSVALTVVSVTVPLEDWTCVVVMQLASVWTKATPTMVDNVGGFIEGVTAYAPGAGTPGVATTTLTWVPLPGVWLLLATEQAFATFVKSAPTVTWPNAAGSVA
jgi:hypothetical protein